MDDGCAKGLLLLCCKKVAFRNSLPVLRDLFKYGRLLKRERRTDGSALPVLLSQVESSLAQTQISVVIDLVLERGVRTAHTGEPIPDLVCPSPHFSVRRDSR